MSDGGYNNERIKEGDKWKAAFKTNQGLFEPTVMFFGMCNSLATFQAMTDTIFVDMIEGCIVIIYMDDILIFARTEEDPDSRTIHQIGAAKITRKQPFLKSNEV